MLLLLGSLVTCQPDEGFSTGMARFCLQAQTNRAKHCFLLGVRRTMWGPTQGDGTVVGARRVGSVLGVDGAQQAWLEKSHVRNAFFRPW